MEDSPIGPKYKDRQESGALLAKRLLPYEHSGPVVVAVPTSSMSAFRRISPLVDHLLCPDVSRLPFFAVANAHGEWRDLEDEEIEDLLKI